MLACFGLVMIYRIDEARSRGSRRSGSSSASCSSTRRSSSFRDYRKLERYRYVIAAAGIGLLLLPRVPGIGAQTNGAYLGVRIPGLFVFQPAEFAKIAIVIFLASYLRDTRQVLVQGARRVLGVTMPPLKHFGPLLVVWGAAMLMLIVIRDLGSSLMFFGGFLAIALRGDEPGVVRGHRPLLFALGAWFFATHVGARARSRRRLAAPVRRPLYDKVGGSYQLAQCLFAQADGGLFGQRLRPGGARRRRRGRSSLPAAEDRPHLRGDHQRARPRSAPAAVLLTYLLVVAARLQDRRCSRATRSRSSSRRASRRCFALQVFVIVGGVTKVIPLTGVTLPFISYGGSSILANFILLALLLLVSDRARRPV